MDFILYPKEGAKLLIHQLVFLHETLASIECSSVAYCLHPFFVRVRDTFVGMPWHDFKGNLPRWFFFPAKIIPLLYYFSYWSGVDLQCCVNLCCTTKWFSYTHIYICSFYIFFYYSLLQDIEYNSLCYTVNPCCLSILCIVVCIC